MYTLKSLTIAPAFVMLLQTSAIAGETFTEALREGEAGLNFRYRIESVEEDAKIKDAFASTLRTNFWYKSGEFKGLSGYFELQNVLPIGDKSYNDTINGKTQYPVVADPEGTEVNQAYIAYSGISDTKLIVGRQAVNLGNQRFVGSVGFRQNDQTADAAVIINSSIPDTTVIYGYVDNVNRIQGDDHPFGDLKTQTHLLHVENTSLENIKLTVYGYWIDLEDMPLYGLSSRTFGVRLDGKHDVSNGVTFNYGLEFAQQSDHADNPTNYDAHYINAEIGVSANGFSAKVGYEELGSDDSVAFQTPLATAHKFNGWADKFLATPAGGLEDIYAKFSYKTKADAGLLKDITIKAAYHDFSSERGGMDYGTEVDMLLSKKINDKYSVALKAASYDADMWSSDTTKVWFTFIAKF